MLLLALSGCTAGGLIPYGQAPVVVDPSPRIVINEVQAANRSTVQSRTGEYADWIELYNPGPVPVELADIALSDGHDAWVGGDGALAVGDFAIVWADGTGEDGRAPFALAKEGEELDVLVGDELVDHVSTGLLDSDASWARFPDAGDPAVTTRPTPGFSNGSAPDGTDPTDRLFQLDRVLDIDLALSDEAMASLRNSPYTEVEGSFACEGAYFPRVGVRIKGVYGSLRSIDAKAAFKVDLNAFDDHRFQGLETLTLNNMVQDPSYVHEWMAYDTFRDAGVPAPRVGYARVWLNGDLMGLYADIETVDDTFLRRWWTDDSGTLYEGAYGQDFNAGTEAGWEYDEGPDPTDRADITEVTAVLDAGPTEENLAALGQLVDLDEFRRVMAVEAVSVHWDGYTTSNNYRIYDDPTTGRFQMIPWGTDQTFHDIWYGPWDGYGRLFQYCLAVPSCYAAYNQELLAEVDRFEARDIWPESVGIEQWLNADIQADPRREFDIPTHRQWTDDTHTVVTTWPPQVREQAEAR
jgi:hypothetical protein